jgi:Flp pilus assembly protein TadD
MEELTAAYPEDADAHATLCMLYGKQKNWSEAEGEGNKALELSPCHERALMNLAMVSYLRGRKGDAIQYLSRLQQAETAWGDSQKASETQQKISALERSRP